MHERDVQVLGAALATPFGTDIRINSDALFAGETAFRQPKHFNSHGRMLGIDPELDQGSGSRAVRLLKKLSDSITFPIPAGTRLFLATTVGAVDLLEKGETCDTSAFLLAEAERIFGLPDGILVSAACASGQTAAALAMRELKAGKCRHALVVGGDNPEKLVGVGAVVGS